MNNEIITFVLALDAHHLKELTQQEFPPILEKQKNQYQLYGTMTVPRYISNKRKSKMHEENRDPFFTKNEKIKSHI